MKRKVFKTRKCKFGLYETRVNVTMKDGSRAQLVDEDDDGTPDYYDKKPYGAEGSGDIPYDPSNLQHKTGGPPPPPPPPPGGGTPPTGTSTFTDSGMMGADSPLLGGSTPGAAQSSVEIDGAHAKAKQLLHDSGVEGYEKAPSTAGAEGTITIRDYAIATESDFDEDRVAAADIRSSTRAGGGKDYHVKGDLEDKLDFDGQQFHKKDGYEDDYSYDDLLSVILYMEPGFAEWSETRQKVYWRAVTDATLQDVDGDGTMEYVGTRDPFAAIRKVSRGGMSRYSERGGDPVTVFGRGLEGSDKSKSATALRELALNESDVWEIVWNTDGMDGSTALELIETAASEPQTTTEATKRDVEEYTDNADEIMADYDSKRQGIAEGMREIQTGIEHDREAGAVALDAYDFEADYDAAADAAGADIANWREPFLPDGSPNPDFTPANQQKAKSAAFVMQDEIRAEQGRTRDLIATDQDEIEKMAEVTELYELYDAAEGKEKEKLQEKLELAYTALSPETKTAFGTHYKFIKNGAVNPKLEGRIAERTIDLQGHPVKDQKAAQAEIGTLDTIEGLSTQYDAAVASGDTAKQDLLKGELEKAYKQLPRETRKDFEDGGFALIGSSGAVNTSGLAGKVTGQQGTLAPIAELGRIQKKESHITDLDGDYDQYEDIGHREEKLGELAGLDQEDEDFVRDFSDAADVADDKAMGKLLPDTTIDLSDDGEKKKKAESLRTEVTDKIKDARETGDQITGAVKDVVTFGETIAGWIEGDDKKVRKPDTKRADAALGRIRGLGKRDGKHTAAKLFGTLSGKESIGRTKLKEGKMYKSRRGEKSVGEVADQRKGAHDDAVGKRDGARKARSDARASWFKHALSFFKSNKWRAR